MFSAVFAGVFLYVFLRLGDPFPVVTSQYGTTALGHASSTHGVLCLVHSMCGAVPHDGRLLESHRVGCEPRRSGRRDGNGVSLRIWSGEHPCYLAGILHEVRAMD